MSAQSRYKYPRTPHLPWSPGVSDDDLRQVTACGFEGKEVVVTEKMDGECTTLYPDYMHARSIDGRHHQSRNWVKRLQAKLAQEIPAGWRICGENLYAEHSLRYDNLESYFYLFAIWNQDNCCLSWDEMTEWSELWQVPMVKVLYRGEWDQKRIQSIPIDTATMEGYVVRTSMGFPFSSFHQHVAKWVRPNHVQTDQHWMSKPVVRNGLKPASGEQGEDYE